MRPIRMEIRLKTDGVMPHFLASRLDKEKCFLLLGRTEGKHSF